MKKNYTFASDNTAGLTPEALKALSDADPDSIAAYGDDHYTQSLERKIGEFFSRTVKAFPVFNGTAANTLSLASLVKPYEAVACHKYAHVSSDECGAPEFFTGGSKLVLIEGENGKIDPSELEKKIQERPDVHFPRIAALTLTFSGEVGTVYSLEELRVIRDICRANSVKIHIDGARFLNGLAALGCRPEEVIEASGASVLSLGLVKIGFSMGEVVVFFDHEASEGFEYRRKQGGQLASKMRYISAPALTAFEDDLILKYAEKCNSFAAKIAEEFTKRGIPIAFPVEANALLAHLPQQLAQGLRERGWIFYDFVEETHRFVCPWSSTDEEIQCLISDLDALS